MIDDRLRVGVAAALCSVVIVLAWLPILRLPLTGADCWPILVQAAGNPLDTCRQIYLERLWEGADFFRPLLTLLTAFEWRLLGETPWGWHLLRLLMVLFTALGCGALATRAGGSRPAGLAAGALVFALHPLQWQTVPAVARDADTLAALLGVAGLLALLSLGKGVLGRRIAGVLLLLAAPLAKETGLAMPLIGLILLLPSWWRRRRESAVQARVDGTLALALAGGLLAEMAWRWWLLGSLGGYHGVVRPVSLGVRLSRLLRGLLGPESLWQALVVGAALVGVLLMAHRLLRQTPPAAPWTLLRIACWSWLAIGLAGALSSPRAGLRHAEVLLAPAAILAGGAWGRIWPRRRVRPALGTTTLAMMAVAGGLLLGPGSAGRLSCKSWQRAGELSARVLELAERSARQAHRKGAQVEEDAGGYRIVARPRGEGVEVIITPFPYRPPGASNTVMALMPYSVRAYLLARGIPDPIRVAPGRSRGSGYGPGSAGRRKTGEE
ncbi:MAG: hypothetical protein Q9Q40_04625 [Acidobacteriota bacterium]|nr:hypothetical protein [Acidobacteriota bacterium]